jgi:hypothetical protein
MFVAVKRVVGSAQGSDGLEINLGEFLLPLLPLASPPPIILPQICRRGLGGSIGFPAVGGLEPRPPHRWIRPWRKAASFDPAVDNSSAISVSSFFFRGSIALSLQID